MASDPWTTFLDWLTTVMVPSWGELISLLPYVLIVGVIGPILTIIVLIWGGTCSTDVAAECVAPRPRPSPHRAGRMVAAYLRAQRALLRSACAHLPSRTPPTCQIDRADLSVTCPVDDTVRAASVEICPACGTRYVLGATSSPLAVVAPSRTA